MDKFKHRLKSYMGTKGITPSTLARRMGVSRATVYNWLNGSQPKDDLRDKLADLLGVNPVSLYYGDKNQVDGNTLQQVLETVEEYLQAEEISLSPKKKSCLIISLLKIIQENGNLPARNILAVMIDLLQ